MTSYIALLRKEAKSDYSVDFPDFPGCVTAGKTLEEAHVRAAEALALHIEGMEADGEAIPAPSSLDMVQLTKEHRDAVPFLVTVQPGSAIQRINVTMPARVLNAIDSYTDRVGMNRSAFLAQAALHELDGVFVRVTDTGLERTVIRQGAIVKVTKKATGGKATSGGVRDRARARA